MPRLFFALPVALLLLASPAHADSAKAHIAAARRAAKAHKWNTALKEWQAAYRISPDSDDLVGMGDAYAGMGDKANARKQYSAYLADPLALDADSVRGKLAALNKPVNDDLALDLSGPPAPPPKRVASADLSLDLSGPPPKPAAVASPPPAAPAKKVATGGDLSLDLPPLAPPPKKPVATASNDLSLDFPVAPPPKKELKPSPATPPASPALGLDFPPLPPPKTQPPPPTPPQKTVVAVVPAKPAPQPAAPVLVEKPRPPAPANAVIATAEPVQHSNRVYGYAAGGLAVGALAVSGVFYLQSKSSQNDFGGSSVQSKALTDSQITTAKSDAKVANVALITGIVLVAATAAIFVF